MSTNSFIEVVPSNVNANSTISFAGGNPVLQFIVGSQDRMLLGNSVRFVGKFVSRLSSTSMSSSNVSPLAMDEKLGVYSTIETLTIKSQRTGQTLETIRHYNRFLASYLPVTTSAQDGIGHQYETNLSLPNYACQQQSVVQIPSASSTGNSFCISLPCGLFNGQNPIPLMEDMVGGLLIEIHLAPDANVFHSDTATSASISESVYEFSDVSLCAELVSPDPAQMAGISSTGTFEYNSLATYYQTINSGNGILNFQLGLSRVLGVFCNMIPAAHINNLVHKGLATLYPVNSDATPAQIQELFFTRNGEKIPISYNIDTLQRTDANNDTMDAQVVFQYMNAVEKFAQLNRTSINPVNTRYGRATTFDKFFADGGCGFGVGVALDSISDQGVDYSRVNFGINMSLNLTTDFPNAVYMFVHHKSTLVFSPQGLQVLN
tara:strand:+ start:1701 stop:2999 length:1299 start_codon:yes stop_codon:yes gene_type:complete